MKRPRFPDDRPPPRHSRPNRPRPHSAPAPAPSHPPAPSRAPAHTSSRASEITYGLRAGLALFGRRRDAIVRIAYARAIARELSALLRWADASGVACSEARDHELEHLASSPQHEGLVIAADPRPYASPNDLVDILAHQRGTAIALDRVRNPYNIGAVLRSAAFFGLDAALLGAPAPHPGLAANAVRVAEGAAEELTVARTTDLADTLGRLRARGVQVVGADGHAEASAIGFGFARPTVLVMGNEREGLGERVRGQCDAVVAIPGSGAVESLNVAVAAGVLISEMVRPRRAL